MGESQQIQTAPIINSIVGNLGQFINLTMMKEAGQRYPKPGKVIRTIHDGIEAINTITNQQNMLAQGYQQNQFTGAITPIVQQPPVQQQNKLEGDFYKHRSEVNRKFDILMKKLDDLTPPAP